VCRLTCRGRGEPVYIVDPQSGPGRCSPWFGGRRYKTITCAPIPVTYNQTVKAQNRRVPACMHRGTEGQSSGALLCDSCPSSFC
jgi:hypothetical protein